MDPLILIGTIIISYLVGAISFVRVAAGFLLPGKDIKNLEVRLANTGENYRVAKVGASSVSEIFGARIGILISLLEVAKAAGLVLAFKQAFPAEPYFLAAAVSALAGHIWPIYYHFRGGSGFTAALGGLVVIDWLGAIICPLAGTLFGVLVLRELSAGFLAWSLLMIPWMWLRTHSLLYVGYAVAVNLLLLLATAPQIRLILIERRTRASFGQG